MMTYRLLLMIFCLLQSPVQAQPLVFTGEATIKYESLQYKTPGLTDQEFVEKTILLNATTPLSAQTSLFLRMGHQSYSDNSIHAKTALDQYGVTWKDSHRTIVIGSQDTYFGACGALFDNSSNVGDGLLRGFDMRGTNGHNAYHLTTGRLDPTLFTDDRAHLLSGTEWAHYFGTTRLLVSYLHIANLPQKTDDFAGLSLNAPLGKGEFIAEMVHSSASLSNQALLVGATYQPTKQQAIRLIAGQLLDNAVPAGKASLGGYDNGIRGFQCNVMQALGTSQRLTVKYSHAETITSNIPIRKMELEYTHLF